MTAAFVVHPLERGDPPAWASAWGQDQFGVWASFAVGDGDDRVEQRMRWIVPGDFTMGSPEDEPGRWDDEGPQRRVRISRGFWLADTPCTQALWNAILGDNPSRFPGPERPIERVSFHAVEKFLKRLGGQIPELSPRLPSEAEWEYACRAGYEGLPVYPLPGQLPGQSSPAPRSAVAWYSENADSTQAVAQKSPNRWGLYDMLGNVDEWCVDCWHRYQASNELLVDPLVAGTEHAFRVVRGGSWHDYARFVRAAYRVEYHPTDAYGDLGFRVARGQEQLQR